MKKLLIAAIASTAFATPAFAQITYEDGVAEYEIFAPVQSFCRFGPGTESSGTNGSVNGDNNNGLPGSDGRFDLNIQNPGNNSVQAADVTYTIPSAICNSGWTITADSENGALTTPVTTSDNDFTSSVGYRVNVRFAGETNGTFTSAALLNGAVVAQSTEARAGQASFRVRVAASNDLLLQGTYFDRVLVTLAPAT